MNTPDFEHQIGIDAFFTDKPGIGGKLRVRIDDFHVTELFSYPTKKENGHFTIAEVTCRNWETHTLVQEIADRLHISQKRISFAGTKDKRSVSTQLMSFHQVAPDHLASVNINDVLIQNIYQSDTPIKIGDLLGNRFEIIVRNIDASVTPGEIKKLISPLESMGGFANYYGIQRFGIIRPITHLVGKLLIQGKYEEAVMTYIAHPLQTENEQTYVLRQELEQTRDYKKAFHSYPDSLNFEKAMLNNLIQNPDDFVGALLQLPKNLLLMFINAYESVLFNKIISERIRRKLPFNQAIPGDIIIPLRKNLMTKEFFAVSESNLTKVNTQISKKKAAVTGLLVGYDSLKAQGEMGDIEQGVIESEHIDLRDFIIPEIPYLSSSGSRRPLLCLLSGLDWTLQQDFVHDEKQALNLRFELQKGSYATSFVREIMKSNDPRNY